MGAVSAEVIYRNQGGGHYLFVSTHLWWII
jgi:hypothetical protein